MFNGAQEIYLVLYSILYGVMLQSLPGGLWPLGRTLRGYKYQNGSYEEKNPCKYRNRTFWSFIILNILPAAYFWMIIIALKKQIINIYNPFHLIFTFWISLGVFGFYRIYYILIICKFEWYDDLKEDIVDKRGLSFDKLSHLVWGIIYLGPGLALFVYSHML